MGIHTASAWGALVGGPSDQPPALVHNYTLVDLGHPYYGMHAAMTSRCSSHTLFRTHPLRVAELDEHGKLLELLDSGYRLDKFRAAASLERYSVIPPVWTELDVNPNHKAPLPVEGQAGRKKGVRRTKRKTSNGEFATSSRAFALHLANSQANVTPALSQGLSQGAGAAGMAQGAGAAGP